MAVGVLHGAEPKHSSFVFGRTGRCTSRANRFRQSASIRARFTTERWLVALRFHDIDIVVADIKDRVQNWLRQLSLEIRSAEWNRLGGTVRIRCARLNQGIAGVAPWTDGAGGFRYSWLWAIV